MCDLISRQTALDAMGERPLVWTGEDYELGCRNQYDEDRLAIETVPSAQPLVLTCDGCRHVGTYDTDFPCSGCIRKEKDYYEQE
jgi:hypothetical protein